MHIQGSTKLRLYLTAVVAACLSILAALAPAAADAARAGPAWLWLVAAAVVVCAVLGASRPFAGDGSRTDGLGLAAPCAFALLLAGGSALAVVTFALAAALGRLWRRPLVMGVLAVAGPVVSLAAAGATMRAVAGSASVLTRPQSAVSDTVAVAASGMVMFALLVATEGTSTALQQRIGVVQQLRHDFSHHLSTTAVLLALAPVVVILATLRPLLLPLLAFPIAVAQ